MKTFEENLFMEATKVVLVENKWRAISVDYEGDRATHRNACYFKYYDTKFSIKSKVARIAFVAPYYFLNHKIGSQKREDWYLNMDERKELMKLLSTKYDTSYFYSGHTVYPATYWEYLLTVYNNMMNVPYEMFAETNPRNVNIYINDNKYYIPIIYPFPDYTKLPKNSDDNKEVTKKKDEFTFTKWHKELLRKF